MVDIAQPEVGHAIEDGRSVGFLKLSMSTSGSPSDRAFYVRQGLLRAARAKLGIRTVAPSWPPQP
eukprot:7659290-Pyramimonas_sp.AAC.1